MRQAARTSRDRTASSRRRPASASGSVAAASRWGTSSARSPLARAAWDRAAGGRRRSRRYTWDQPSPARSRGRSTPRPAPAHPTSSLPCLLLLLALVMRSHRLPIGSLRASISWNTSSCPHGEDPRWSLTSPVVSSYAAGIRTL